MQSLKAPALRKSRALIRYTLVLIVRVILLVVLGLDLIVADQGLAIAHGLAVKRHVF